MPAADPSIGAGEGSAAETSSGSSDSASKSLGIAALARGALGFPVGGGRPHPIAPEHLRGPIGEVAGGGDAAADCRALE